MKICTITCHDVYNYGASLQAFALQFYLENCGHEVRIIDYKPIYQTAYKFSTEVSKDSPLYKYYTTFPLLKYFKGCFNYLEQLKTRKRIPSFKRFNKEFLKLTNKYYSNDDLVLNPPQADIYIAGSDQIWNTNIQNGLDPAYYMCFGDKKTRRVAYAASFGVAPKSLEESIVKEMLSNIDDISVRELTGLDILKNLGLSGIQVVDPVFLLSSENWIKALNIDKCKKVISDKYILVYDIAISMQEKELFAKKLAKQYDCKIVSVNGIYTNSYADVNINNASPVDFVNLIANAEAVIADSFHATSFSIIFHKPFYTFYKLSNISRMEDLLKMLDLSDRLNSKNILPNPNWNIVEIKLHKIIESSKAFLNNVVR